MLDAGGGQPSLVLALVAQRYLPTKQEMRVVGPSDPEAV